MALRLCRATEWSWLRKSIQTRSFGSRGISQLWQLSSCLTIRSSGQLPVAAYLGSLGFEMGDWTTIIILSTIAGVLCAAFFRGTTAWVASALLPWLGVLAWLLYQEYFVPYRGGGASMWPIAQLFAGTVAAGVGLTAHAAVKEVFRAKP